MKSSRNKFSDVYRTLVSTKYMVNFVWRDGKSYMFFTIINAILHSVALLIYTTIPGLIIDELTGGQDKIQLAIYVGIVTLSPLIQCILQRFINGIITKKRLDLKMKLSEFFYSHTACMDYETLEKPDVQTMKERAADTISSAFNVVDQLSNLLVAVLGFLVISSLVITLHPLVIVLICVMVYLNSIITKRLNKLNYETGIEIDKNSRHAWAATYMLNNIHFAKEMRLFNLKDMFIGNLSNITKVTNKLLYKQFKDKSNANVLQSTATFFQDVAIYIYVIYLVIKNGITIGQMTIFMNAVRQFSSKMNQVVKSYLSLANSSQKIQELISFMDMPLRQYELGDKVPIFDKKSVIEFKNVSFKYPGSDRYALKNFNLTILGNEKLCIVGVNGAGKTTFINLLTRLYFPTDGEILLNGININEYNYEKYQRLFAPVFQDFARYYLSLGENIVLGDAFDKERLDFVCQNSGIGDLVNKLPKGYDTHVDKWVDETGFTPSGGEYQRIAIARACYHNGQIFLLDEPTASLDPMAEYEIYTQFNHMITDKCAVLITHRLSAVQLADKVAVFDSGSVAEYGTHKELYEKGGIYTEMFDKQARFYRDEKTGEN